MLLSGSDHFGSVKIFHSGSVALGGPARCEMYRLRSLWELPPRIRCSWRDLERSRYTVLTFGVSLILPWLAICLACVCGGYFRSSTIFFRFSLLLMRNCAAEVYTGACGPLILCTMAMPPPPRVAFPLVPGAKDKGQGRRSEG